MPVARTGYAESAAAASSLIAELRERMIVAEAEYHHIWRKGEVVIRDNRCSYHNATADYSPEEDRIHWRVSINNYGNVVP
jgi:taurine dioxygenase